MDEPAVRPDLLSSTVQVDGQKLFERLAMRYLAPGTSSYGAPLARGLAG